MGFGSLEHAALKWLRYRRRCQIVALERWVFDHAGRPDVVGVNHKCYVIEIEVKRTWSDFNADSKKHKVSLIPPTRQRYYLAPRELAERIASSMSEVLKARGEDYDWGVITPFGDKMKVYRRCQVNPLARKLTNKQLWGMISKMSGTLVKQQEQIDREK